MRDTELFQAALGLGTPWSVSGSRFDAVARRLDIEIAFAKGARFACPTCGAAGCPAYDTEQLTCGFAIEFWPRRADGFWPTCRPPT